MSDRLSRIKNVTQKVASGDTRFIPPPSKIALPNRSRKEREGIVKNTIASELSDTPPQKRLPTATQVVSHYKKAYFDKYNEEPISRKYATTKLAKTLLVTTTYDIDHIKEVLDYLLENWDVLRKELRFTPVRPAMNYVMKLEVFIVIRDYMISSSSEKNKHHFVDRAKDDDEYKQMGFFDDE